MSARIPGETDPVVVAIAGREIEGVVSDVRWTPRYNTTPTEAMSIVVDIGSANVVASPDQLSVLQ